jgi:hypothetical protein
MPRVGGRQLFALSRRHVVLRTGPVLMHALQSVTCRQVGPCMKVKAQKSALVIDLGRCEGPDRVRVLVKPFDW